MKLDLIQLKIFNPQKLSYFLSLAIGIFVFVMAVIFLIVICCCMYLLSFHLWNDIITFSRRMIQQFTSIGIRSKPIIYESRWYKGSFSLATPSIFKRQIVIHMYMNFYSIFKKSYWKLWKVLRYSRFPNKRRPPNKHRPWKSSQKQ